MNRLLPLAALLAAPLFGQLPEGAGRAETERLCKTCHELPKAVSLRQDRNGWATTLKRMVAFGMKASDPELITVLDYLEEHFPAELLPPIYVNKARAIQLESRLSLKRSEASAILRYKKEHGPFKNLEELLQVPGIDAAKIEAKKDALVFD